MPTLRIKAAIEHNATPREVATLFANMNELEQAQFFNALAEDAAGWEMAFCFQMQSVTDADILTDAARDIMKTIGDYSGKTVDPAEPVNGTDGH